jgi:glycogen operon protein
MNDEAWNADFVRSLGMLLAGNAIDETDERGETIVGDTLLVLLNAHSDEVPFTLPAIAAEQQWQRVADTVDPQASEAEHLRFSSRAVFPLQGRSVVVFRLIPPVRERRRSIAQATAALPVAAEELGEAIAVREPVGMKR